MTPRSRLHTCGITRSIASRIARSQCAGSIPPTLNQSTGMGFTNEVGLVHAYNTLRVINIADGTNEILRRTIWQQLAQGDLEL